MISAFDSIQTPNNEQESLQKSNTIFFKTKLGSNSLQETLDQIKVNNVKANNTKTFQLDVMKEIYSKKFFVKLLGYNPRFFYIKDIKKKINEVIEDYLKGINFEICDKVKQSFAYRGKNINLDETIENIDHLSWITSSFAN